MTFGDRQTKRKKKKPKGGTEKIRGKRLKSLEIDAAKCFKITIHLVTLPVIHHSLVSLKAMAEEEGEQRARVQLAQGYQFNCSAAKAGVPQV